MSTLASWLTFDSFIPQADLDYSLIMESAVCFVELYVSHIWDFFVFFCICIFCFDEQTDKAFGT